MVTDTRCLSSSNVLIAVASALALWSTTVLGTMAPQSPVERTESTNPWKLEAPITKQCSTLNAQSLLYLHLRAVAEVSLGSRFNNERFSAMLASQRSLSARELRQQVAAWLVAERTL